jgi:hypothetical protein
MRRVTTPTQTAVFLVLFGFVCLFGVESPYNWLAGFMIVGGVLLQLRERKVQQARNEAMLRKRYGYPPRVE